MKYRSDLTFRPLSYQSRPTETLERWFEVCTRAEQHNEAAIIRREIAKRNKEEIAA